MPETLLISIIHDDALARDGIRELVESLGYKARTFVSAEHFLESGVIAESMPDHRLANARTKRP
jgi:FixJ family two-component response regulator